MDGMQNNLTTQIAKRLKKKQCKAIPGWIREDIFGE
jgi:hypothetical protein